jgi:hypothetical protein
LGPLSYWKIIDAPAETCEQDAILIFAAKPTGTVSAIEVSVQGYYRGTFDPDVFGYGELTADWTAESYLVAGQYEIDEGAGFTIRELSNLRTISATEGGFQRGRFMLYIETWDTTLEKFVGEFISFKYCTPNEDGTYTVSHLIRGVHNTPIQSYHAGDRFG